MTSGKKILGVTGGVVAVLVLGKIGLGFLHQPDDKTLILEAVQEAQKASREGRPGGVLDFLSVASLKVNDQDATGSRRDIADYIKKQKPDIQFKEVDPKIFGETAVDSGRHIKKRRKSLLVSLHMLYPVIHCAYIFDYNLLQGCCYVKYCGL